MPRNLIVKKLVISSLIIGAASFAGQAADTTIRGENLDGHIIGDIALENHPENAMDPAKKAALLECVRVVYSKVPTLSARQVETEYNKVLNFVNSAECKNVLRAEPANAPLANPVNQPYAEMYRNALFVLTGLRGPQTDKNHWQVDGIPNNGNLFFDGSVKMKDLLARVWVLISTHQNLQNVELMKGHLLWKLNACVENDGHLVCNKGKAQRLMEAIEGFIDGIKMSYELPEVDTFCAAYVTELFEKLDPTDPLQFFITFEVPDTFSFENLEERIKKEREGVVIRINGMYGENSSKAYAAIEKMEESFNAWKEMHYQYNDNLTTDQKSAGKKAVREKAAADQQARQAARRKVEARQAAERPVVQPRVQPRVQPVRPVVQPRVQPRVQPVRPVVQPRVQPRVQPVRPVVQPRVQPRVQPVRPVVQPVVQAPVQHLTPKQAKAAQRAAARQAKAAQRAAARQVKQQARQNKAAHRAAARQAKAAQRAAVHQIKQQAKQAKAAVKQARKLANQQAKAQKRAAAQQAKLARLAR